MIEIKVTDKNTMTGALLYLFGLVGYGFNPDTLFIDYVNKVTGEQTFSLDECERHQILLGECIDFCDKNDLNIYCVLLSFLMKYDGYELQKVAEFTDGCCVCIKENEILNGAIKIFWTIYGHISTGGVEAIADFEDREQAEIIFDLLND